MQVLVSGLFSAADSYGKSEATFEIILMLLISFLLGYLLRYFLDKSKASSNEDEYRRYSLLEGKLNDKQAELDKLKIELDNCYKKKDNAALAFASSKKSVIKDDLKKIEGIGPKIEQLLFGAEIYTWEDLANTDVNFIQDILDEAGPKYQVHNPESWPFQAKLAHEGRWNELQKWQDEHKSGRF